MLVYEIRKRTSPAKHERLFEEQVRYRFAVNTPYLTGSMGTTHYQAKAHPQDQLEIEFLINGDVYDLRMNGKYDDEYLPTKWSYQGKQEVEKKLKEVYGEGVNFRIRRDKFVAKDRYAFKDLDYAQVFEKSHGHDVIFLD